MDEDQRLGVCKAEGGGVAGVRQEREVCVPKGKRMRETGGVGESGGKRRLSQCIEGIESLGEETREANLEVEGLGIAEGGRREGGEVLEKSLVRRTGDRDLNMDLSRMSKLVAECFMWL